MTRRVAGAAPRSAAPRAPARSRALAATLVLAGAAALAAPAAASGPGAAVVERLHSALARNMAQPERGFEERVATLEPVVSEVFDFGAIARVAMGRSWEGLDEARRVRVEELLFRESLLTYADRFHAGGEGARFVTDAEQPARAGRLFVRSRLLSGDGDPVSLDYLLHEEAGRWRIVNVLAQGVSDLSLKRAQFAAVIRDAGVDALLARLAESVDALERAGRGGS